MEKAILKNNDKLLMDNDKLLVKTYPTKELTDTNVTDVSNYGYVQIVDENLIPENIPLGKTILGIPGSYAGNLAELINGNISNITNNTNKIREAAFYSCIELKSIDFPMCSYIGSQAFDHCVNLTKASFPMCSYIGSYAFKDCVKLTEANFPVCSYIGRAAFQQCNVLKNISSPVCGYIGENAFGFCSFLTEASFPMCSYIGKRAFVKCLSLTSLYLNVSSVPVLESTNAFSSTPISSSIFLGYFGSIYVPESLYKKFCDTTNWATFSRRIVSYNF